MLASILMSVVSRIPAAPAALSGGPLARPRRTGTVSRVALPDVEQKTLNCNRVSFFDQLLITAPRPYLGAGHKVDFEDCVREHDRPHVASVGDQPWRTAKRPLASHQGRYHGGGD